MIVLVLFIFAVVIGIAGSGIFFLVAGVQELLLGEVEGILVVLFGVIFMLGAVSLVVILFLPA